MRKSVFFPPRAAGNYRTYDSGHLHQLRFVRRCRELGFTLDQVRELLSLSTQTDRDCADVDKLAIEHLLAVEQKIADLKAQIERIKTRSKRSYSSLLRAFLSAP